MRLAIIAVTEAGAALGEKIAQAVPGDLYVKQGRHAAAGQCREYTALKDVVGDLFLRYDGLIFIMAAGIVVRMIAPHIVHKKIDPAVVVLDERGIHAISLLSGHIGGANALTARIAGVIGAETVITTATDVNDKIAPDALAAELGLMPEPFERLKKINAEIAGGAAVDFFVDDTLRNAAFYRDELHARGISPLMMQLSDQTDFHRTAVCITDCEPAPKNERVLYLKPRRLSVGIGCRKDAAEEEILDALNLACASIGKTSGDVICLASTVVKREEAGLLAAADRLNIPIRFFDHKALQTVIEDHRLECSDFVLSKIGVGNVCEAAAIANSQSKKLAVRKMKFSRVTVAAAWEK